MNKIQKNRSNWRETLKTKKKMAECMKWISDKNKNTNVRKEKINIKIVEYM